MRSVWIVSLDPSNNYHIDEVTFGNVTRFKHELLNKRYHIVGTFDNEEHAKAEVWWALQHGN